MSPDGRWLVTVEPAAIVEVELWDLEKLKRSRPKISLRRTLEFGSGDGKWPRVLPRKDTPAFSPNNKFIFWPHRHANVRGPANGSMAVLPVVTRWNIATGDCELLHLDELMVVDSRAAASASQRPVLGEALLGNVMSISFSGDGKMLLGLSGRDYHYLEEAGAPAWYAVDLVDAGGTCYMEGAGRVVTVSVNEQGQFVKVDEVFDGLPTSVFAASFSVDEKLVVAASQCGHIMVWQRGSDGGVGRLLRSFLLGFYLLPNGMDDAKIRNIQLSPNNRKIMLVSGQGKVCVWDSDSKEVITNSEGGETGSDEDEQANDRPKIVPVGEACFNVISDLQRSRGGVYTFSGRFSDDGRLALVEVNGEMSLWNVETREKLVDIGEQWEDGSDRAMHTAAFLPA